MLAPVTDVVVTMVQYRQVAIHWLRYASPYACHYTFCISLTFFCS
jgi:hypothetical protein